MFRFLNVWGCLIAFCLIGGPAVAGTVTVNSLADTDADDGICTLREAIVATNDNANHNGCTASSYSVSDTIVFNVSLSGTIVMTADLPVITDSVTVDGPGPATLTVSGVDLYRLFVVESGGLGIQVTIKDITITRGYNWHTPTGGGIYVGQDDVLSVTNCIVSKNRANYGGGIGLLGASLNVTDTEITENTAILYNGGGIFNNQGTVTLTRSTVSGNTAKQGGGIHNQTSGGSASLTIVNSTISGNSVTEHGGGIYGQDIGAPTLDIRDSTVVYNVADKDNNLVGDGGGIYGLVTSMRNTVVALNRDYTNPTSPFAFAYNDCAGTIASDDYNLIAHQDGCTIIGTTTHNIPAGTPPDLGPLQNNGGITPTHALLRGSPGVDQGGDCETTDQRSVPRPRSGTLAFTEPFICDIGAHELDLPGTSAITVNTLTDEDNGGGDCSLREAMLSAENDADTGGCTHTGTYGPDIIVFDGGLSGNITLGSALPPVSGELAIEGPGSSTLSIDGGGLYRMFFVLPPGGTPFHLSGLTLENGRASTGQGAALLASNTEIVLDDITARSNVVGFSGGAVSIQYGSLTISNSTFSGNIGQLGHTSGNGGAIYVDNADLKITNSTFTDNRALAGPGGGVAVYDGTIACDGCIFDGNSAAGWGGGVHVLTSDFSLTGMGSVEFTDSTFRGNRAGEGIGGAAGGGVALQGKTYGIVSRMTANGNRVTGDGGGLMLAIDHGTRGVMVVNSTFSGNTASGSGGGIYIGNGIVRVANATIVDNIAGDNTFNLGDGGGIYASGENVEVANSIIALNDDLSPTPTDHPDCSGALDSGGYNLLSVATGCSWGGTPGSHVIGDPVLSGLGDQNIAMFAMSDKTDTHYPLAGSPAVDAGDPGGCVWDDDYDVSTPPVDLAADQRGSSRPVDGDAGGGTACDIGAVEAGYPVYELFVSVVGGGSVDSPLWFSPQIQCGPDCVQTYGTSGSSVADLVATADSGWQFFGWSGDCSGTLDSCSVTIGGNSTVTATFVLDPAGNVDHDALPNASDACPENAPAKTGATEFATVQDGLDAAALGDGVLKLQTGTLNATVTVTHPNPVEIRGAYNCDFTGSGGGETILGGPFTIDGTAGAVTIDGVGI